MSAERQAGQLEPLRRAGGCRVRRSAGLRGAREIGGVDRSRRIPKVVHPRTTRVPFTSLTDRSEIGPGDATSGSPTARNEFRRPPVATRFAKAGTASTRWRIRFFASTGPMFGKRERTSATVPVTWGVAIDVPLNVPYWPLGNVLRMLSPGAARSTEVFPQLDQLGFWSFISEAATERIVGRS